MTRHVRRGGKVWIRVFPDKPVTAKPAETRMGSGKGNPEFWVAVVKPGRVLFELGGVSEALARSAMDRAIQKLPIKARFVSPRPPRRGRGVMSPPLELRELNDEELAQRLVEAKQELFQLRFQVATGKQDNSARLGQVRRDVARVADAPQRACRRATWAPRLTRRPRRRR